MPIAKPSKSRYYLSLIVIGIFSIAYGPIILVICLLPRRLRINIIAAFIGTIYPVLCWVCNIKLVIEGRQYLPKKPSIIVSNHQSVIENPILFVILKPVTKIIKKSLLYIPIIGAAMWASSFIAIDRSRPREALKIITKEVETRIKSGLSVVIYPEGTRWPPDRIKPYKRGFAKIAQQTATDIIPVVHNLGTYWLPSSCRPGTATIRIGPTITVADKTIEQIAQAVEKWTQENYRTLTHPNK